MQISEKIIYPQDNIDHNNNNNDNSNYYLKNKTSDDVSRKVGDVSYHYFNSYMAGFALKTTLALTFTAALLATALLTTAVPIIVPIAVSLRVVALLLINVIKKRKELLFEISLLYTVKNGGHDWCTPITDNIILGALPLENHKQMLKDLGVTKVLTMIEKFERQPGLINPLSKKDLESLEIDNLELPSADFIGVPVDTIRKGVDFMNTVITKDKKEKIYVHCKAGRGRSASVVVAYLIKYGTKEQTFKNFDEAYDFVKKLRPQINLNKNQKSTILEYWRQDCQA